jgi:hypothetical protein
MDQSKYDLTVAAVWRRLKIKLTDLNPGRSAALGPCDLADIANDEKRLGFAFPPLLKRLYTEIGNGGFGPGYGLIGLTNGVPDDLGRTAPATYELLRGSTPNEPHWTWPTGLLPICHWGCAISSCIDCTDPDFRMRIFDPNAHGEGDDWADALFEEAVSFDSWIAAWASGISLWDMMYGEDGAISRARAQGSRKR